MTDANSISVDKVIVRDDLYPRMKHDQARAQQYSEILDLLPEIEVNQNYELIDGKHRLIGHKLANRTHINAKITKTKSDTHLLFLACKRNASFGLQLSPDDKKKMAKRFYLDETTWGEFSSAKNRSEIKSSIAEMLSCSKRLVEAATSDIDQQMREERKEKIIELWLRCWTSEEIAEEVNIPRQNIDDDLKELLHKNEQLRKSAKVTFSDDFQIPLYNVWAFGKKTNGVDHFGNTEKRIVDNLLYLYTEPFDIVVDPFAGGGSTAEVCRERYRRFWLSDRKPKAGLEDQIRTMDIVAELPSLHKRWSEVSLVYLDPPYWKQAEGQYSKDPADLANYADASEFHDAMADIVKRFAAKVSKGVIALIIQPTQWKSPERQFTDHVVEIVNRVKSKNLRIENRISCPYQTEQCTPQMVDWAKENKSLLVLSRELIVWRVL